MFLWSIFKYICNSDKYESCFIAIEVLTFSLHSASELLNPMLLNKYTHTHTRNVFPQNIIQGWCHRNNNTFVFFHTKYHLVNDVTWFFFSCNQMQYVSTSTFFHISLWKWILTWSHSSMWPAFIETRGSNICFGVLVTWWGSFCKP